MAKKTKWTDEDFMEAAETAFLECAILRGRRLEKEAARLNEVARSRATRPGAFTDEEFRRLAEESFT